MRGVYHSLYTQNALLDNLLLGFQTMVLTTTLYCDSNFGRHFICFSNRIHKDINYYIMKVNRFGKCGSTLTHIGPQAEHKKIYRVPMGTHMYPWYGTHMYPYVPMVPMVCTHMYPYVPMVWYPWVPICDGRTLLYKGYPPISIFLYSPDRYTYYQCPSPLRYHIPNNMNKGIHRMAFSCGWLWEGIFKCFGIS